MGRLLGRVEGWVRDDFALIDENPALRFYAIVLSGLQTLTALSWFSYKSVAQLASGDQGICWPTIPDCNAVRAHLTASTVRELVITYAILGLVAAGLFLARKPKAAVPTFVAATVLGTFIYALDYRLRSNETYMFSWCVAVFLFAPRKSAALQAVVGLFYFWAGTLKVNSDWTSGAALYRHPFLVPEALVPASCVYVLVLELVLVWGLFSPSARIRWAVYAQLLLFHAVSWKVVGYHYPLLMFGLTSIYPLVWRLTPEDSLTWNALRAEPQARFAVGGVALVFSTFQLVPRLRDGDSAITGEGRVFALHMFDGRIECEGGATVHVAGGKEVHVEIIDRRMTERTKCDPVYLLAAAKKVCRKAEGHPDIGSVDVAVDARRATDVEMKPLMHIDDFCSKSVEYSAWHHNEWIGR